MPLCLANYRHDYRRPALDKFRLFAASYHSNPYPDRWVLLGSASPHTLPLFLISTLLATSLGTVGPVARYLP